MRHVHVMVTVRQNLGFDDRYQSCLLANRGVPRQGFGVFGEAQIGRSGSIRADRKDAAPLGEPCALLVEVRASHLEAVHPRGGGFASGLEARNDRHAFVDFDAGDDASFLEQVHEGDPVRAALPQRLLEHDHAGAPLVEPGGGEQKLAQSLSVSLRVLDADGAEPLADRARALVRGEDAFARRGQRFGGGHELGGVGGMEVRHV